MRSEKRALFSERALSRIFESWIRQRKGERAAFYGVAGEDFAESP